MRIISWVSAAGVPYICPQVVKTGPRHNNKMQAAFRINKTLPQWILKICIKKTPL